MAASILAEVKEWEANLYACLAYPTFPNWPSAELYASEIRIDDFYTPFGRTGERYQVWSGSFM